MPMLLDDQRNRQILDGFRAIGILLVILFHSLLISTKLVQKSGGTNNDFTGIDALIDAFPRALNIAWHAVGSEMIFLVSGFLLSYLLFREYYRKGGIDLYDFFVRRLSRIIPLYLIALMLYGLDMHYSLEDLALNLLFNSKAFDMKTIIPVGWSLEVMMQVYVLLPFLVILVMRNRRPVLLMSVLMLLSLLPRWIALSLSQGEYLIPVYELIYQGGGSSRLQQDLYFLTIYRATPFLMGLLIAYLAVFRADWLCNFFSKPLLSSGLLVLGVILVALSSGVSIQDKDAWAYTSISQEFWLWFWTFHRFVFASGISLLMLAILHNTQGLARSIGGLFQWNLWGMFSHNIYSIYLFHFICLIPAALLVLVPQSLDRMEIFVSQPKELIRMIDHISVIEVLLIFFLTAFFSVKLAVWITRYVEKPSQEWIRRRFAQQQA
ncbi:MAG: acyltransferase [Candidatus Thiodiazotropha sp. (ex Ctena orbiculata)]|nr:acyltransferase [Candidatus Thiodiazotropha taylori]MBT2998179.1 acyltransferase [Candidatus Thiodiazotropha taylori]MBT3002477.1 acyltransferase [Candidatus Thiodiazotropha taylori]MBV2112777.1 acyltransferase [Candidatus Thiodiazotropha taylori]